MINNNKYNYNRIHKNDKIYTHTVELVQSDILWHSTNIYGPQVYLLTKVKPEYFDILYNLTHSLVPWCVVLDRF